MQVDNEQFSHQLSEAPRQVITPGSMLGQVMPDHQLVYKHCPIYAASEHSPWQALQQERSSDLQGDTDSHIRAASALPLDLEAPQGLFRASAPARPLAAVPQWPSAPWRQTPQAVTTPLQPPSHLTHPHAGHSGQAQLHSLGHQPLPAQSIPLPSLQQYPTSLPQQEYSSSDQWAHPTGRRGMLQTHGQAYVPQSSLPASVDTAQPSSGASQGLARDPMHTPRPDVSHSLCWSVPAQLQSQLYAAPMPMCSSTAAPATSSWAVSHLTPQSLPLRHPIQAPHPSSYSEPPPKRPSQAQAQAQAHRTPHGNQGPNPSLPPRAPSQGPHPYPPVSHSFPGQGSSTVPASRPYSRCDHPSYAHLDLSRPLCLQQPPVSGHPAAVGSYSSASHVAEDPVCFQPPPVSGYPGSLGCYSRSVSPFVECDRPSLQQQPRSTAADLHHLPHQQLHEGSQQGVRRSGLMDLQAQQQGPGSGFALAACRLEQLRRQTQPCSNTVDPATCTGAWPQSSWTPLGVLLKPKTRIFQKEPK